VRRDGIGVKTSFQPALIGEVLRQQAGDKAFADASFALEERNALNGLV
jgi:hypothetical protein